MLDIQSILENWQTDPEFAGSIASCKTIPASKGELRDLPTDITPALREALISKGVTSLYSHQADAFHLLAEGKSVVVSTGTASGKTLCYNLPAVQQALSNPNSRVLYLFPTKALAQDQLISLSELLKAVSSQKPLTANIFDGDTPQHMRSAMRAIRPCVLFGMDARARDGLAAVPLSGMCWCDGLAAVRPGMRKPNLQIEFAESIPQIA